MHIFSVQVEKQILIWLINFYHLKVISGGFFLCFPVSKIKKYFWSTKTIWGKNIQKIDS
jgi:hypothetical protein